MEVPFYNLPEIKKRKRKRETYHKQCAIKGIRLPVEISLRVQVKIQMVEQLDLQKPLELSLSIVC